MSVQRIILVGSGDASSTPSTSCLLSETPCPQCRAAHNNLAHPCNRNQTALLIEVDDCKIGGGDGGDSDSKNKKAVLCDCPLTFRDSVLKAFHTEAFAFPRIHAFVATRAHHDALLGVDDIREVTVRGEVTTLFCPKAAEVELRRIFPYIMPGPRTEKQKALWTSGLSPTSIPLAHGVHFSLDDTGFAALTLPVSEQCVGVAIMLATACDDARRKIAVYINHPIDAALAAELAPIFAPYSVEVAIVGFPLPLSSATWQAEVESICEATFKPRKVILCRVPHHVPVLQKSDDDRDSVVELGSDMQVCWKRE